MITKKKERIWLVKQKMMQH